MADSAEPDERRNIFPFLELARELRDAIYNETVAEPFYVTPEGRMTTRQELDDDDSSDDFEGHSLHLMIHDFPVCNLLRTCRQIKDEYEQRCSLKRSKLVMYDHPDCCLHSLELQSDRLTSLTRLECRMALRCNLFSGIRRQCDLGLDLINLTEICKRMSEQMPKLVDVVLDLRFPMDDAHTCDWLALLPSDREDRTVLATFPDNFWNLTKVMLSPYLAGVWEVTDEVSQNKLVATWTRTEGWEAEKLKNLGTAVHGASWEQALAER